MRKNSSIMAIAAMAAMASAASTAVAQSEVRQRPPLRDAGFEPAVMDAPFSKNGGRRGKGMAAKRAAMKLRNVKRHRKACR